MIILIFTNRKQDRFSNSLQKARFQETSLADSRIQNYKI